MIEDKILKELELAEQEMLDIDSALSSGKLDSNMIRDLSKKRNDISEVVGLYKEYKKITVSIEENNELLSEPDLKELAEEEIKILNQKLEDIENKIKEETKPVDPLDT